MHKRIAARYFKRVQAKGRAVEADCGCEGEGKCECGDDCNCKVESPTETDVVMGLAEAMQALVE